MENVLTTQFQDVQQALSYGNLPYLTTGADPEIFCEFPSGNIVPAWEILPPKTSGTGLFWDGFQAEFTPLAGGCMDRFAAGIRTKLMGLGAILREAHPTARLTLRSCVEVPKTALESGAAEHIALACQESQNAYALRGEPIGDPRRFPLRFAGGHIHYGFVPESRPAPEVLAAQCLEAVKFMDATIGLVGVSLSEGLDDPRRRHHYGLAGEYRLPLHGLEYRVLSNFWLAHPAVYHLVFDIARACCKLGYAGYREKLLDAPEGAVVEAINNSDVQTARALIERNRGFFRGLFNFLYARTPSIVEFACAKLFQPLRDWPIEVQNLEWNWENLNWTPGVLEYGGFYVYPQRFNAYWKHSTQPDLAHMLTRRGIEAKRLEVAKTASLPSVAGTVAPQGVAERAR